MNTLRPVCFMGFLLAVLFAAGPVAARDPLPASAPDSQAETAPGSGEQHIGNDIVDVYDRAVAHLEKICDDYRRIKALQLSKRLDMAFGEAYDNISSVMPNLDPIDRKLLRRDIRRPEDIQVHKEEVEQVKAQVEMMIDLTTKLLEEIEQKKQEIAEELQQMEHRDITLEEIVAREEFDPEEEVDVSEEREQSQQPLEQQLREVAQQDDAERVKDLTPIMHQLIARRDQRRQQQKQQLEERQRRKEAEEEKNDEQAEEEKRPEPRRPRQDIADLTKEAAEEERRQPRFISSDIRAGSGLQRLDTENYILGRTVKEGTEPVEWVFIDTWWTIGPFPNPQRKNITRKFPPENVIDLDGEYPGKDGRLVEWQFVQSNEPRVDPVNAEPYGIWYAYPEV